jgi:hypothetical protein
MKMGNLVIVAGLVPMFFCHAQNLKPDDKAAGTAPAASAVAAAPDTYVIGASDELTVTVWKEPTLSGALLVRPDGMISVPLLGDGPGSERLGRANPDQQ